jgi:hypothetical protein
MRPPAEPRVPATQPAVENDQSLAEMAHRLEAALRKPNPTADTRPGRSPAAPARPAPAVEDEQQPESSATPAPPRTARAAEPASQPRSNAKSGQGKTLYDSLEQEMASLLGRPTNKT